MCCTKVHGIKRFAFTLVPAQPLEMPGSSHSSPLPAINQDLGTFAFFSFFFLRRCTPSIRSSVRLQNTHTHKARAHTYTHTHVLRCTFVVLTRIHLCGTHSRTLLCGTHTHTLWYSHAYTQAPNTGTCTHSLTHSLTCVCVYVCVCLRRVFTNTHTERGGPALVTSL
jgi:hypothetical protein